MQHGFPIRYYKKLGPNEALDCFVYNMAALEILSPNFEKLAENMAKAAQPVVVEKAQPQTVNRPRPQAPKIGGGWVHSWE